MIFTSVETIIDGMKNLKKAIRKAVNSNKQEFTDKLEVIGLSNYRTAEYIGMLEEDILSVVNEKMIFGNKRVLTDLFMKKVTIDRSILVRAVIDKNNVHLMSKMDLGPLLSYSLAQFSVPFIFDSLLDIIETQFVDFEEQFIDTLL